MRVSEILLNAMQPGKGYTAKQLTKLTGQHPTTVPSMLRVMEKKGLVINVTEDVGVKGGSHFIWMKVASTPENDAKFEAMGEALIMLKTQLNRIEDAILAGKLVPAQEKA